MHLSGMIIFSARGRLRGAMSPSVNLGPRMSRFFVRWLLCVKLVLCFSFLHSFAMFVVKVMGQGQTYSKLCEGQLLCHSALRCCLVYICCVDVNHTCSFLMVDILYNKVHIADRWLIYCELRRIKWSKRLFLPVSKVMCTLCDVQLLIMLL